MLQGQILDAESRASAGEQRKYRLEERPEWASHALTTGPLWDGIADMNGKIDFGQEGSDGNLYDGPYEEASCVFVIGNDAWVVVSVRPVKPTA